MEQLFVDKAIVESVSFHVERIYSLMKMADPDVERSYKRLVEQIRVARNAAESSVRFEEELEKRIILAPQSVEISEWQALLRDHRRQNIFIDQQLFRASCVISRIFAIRLLLNALPIRTADHTETFRRLMRECLSYLNEVRANDVENKDVLLSTDFPEELSALESKIHRAYIYMVREEMHFTNVGSPWKLLTEIDEMSALIELEIVEQRSKFEHWDAVMKDALVNETELVRLIASKRCEQSVTTLASLERSLDVVSVVAEALKAKHPIK